jgi:TctA family transporter
VGAVTITLELPEHLLDVPEQRAGFVLLCAFLISFLFIRTSARLMRSPRVPWWPGSVTTDSGLHLHHLVWGIVLLIVSGFLGFVTNAKSPWEEILAALFGVGAGFTLDEFALWIHLRDVYWAEEGRSSFDAVVVAAVLGGLVVVGFAPFDLSRNAASIETLVAAVVIDVLLASLAILKGKPMMGVVGLFIPFVSLVASIRLAAPTSWWARRWYKEKKLARSEKRYKRIKARHKRIVDAILGPPGEAPPVLEEAAVPAAKVGTHDG